MRSRSSYSLLLLSAALLSIRSSIASPIDEYAEYRNGTQILRKRCAQTCGYYRQVCCDLGETCSTDASGEAICSTSVEIAAPQITEAPIYDSTQELCASCEHASAAGGYWSYWTSYYTSTTVVCQTYSSFIPYAQTSYAPPQTTAAAVDCSQFGYGASSCGSICCASDQYCQWEGSCAPKYHSSFVQQTQTWYPPAVVQTSYVSYTAPVRPTTSAIITRTVTPTQTQTLTTGFLPAVTTGAGVTIASESGGGGLSGGAIAGIVIGVIIGIIILILLCLCLCFGAAASSIAAFFGFGKKKDRRRREEVEYYHRHGSRADGRTWYGSGKPPPKKKSSGGVGKGGVLAALAGFAAALGLAKRKDKKRRDEKSDYSSSYYDSSYSGSSSDRRTRDTRRSRR